MLFEKKQFTLKNGTVGFLRPAQVEDAQLILDVFYNIAETSPYILSTPDSVRKKTLEEEIKWIQNNNSEPTSILILADVESRIVGLTNFSAYKGVKQAHRGALGTSVKSEYRGQGLGIQMMTFLIENIRSMKTILSVELNVMAPNTPALDLYKKIGFNEVGRKPHAYRMADGTFVDDIAMQLWIG